MSDQKERAVTVGDQVRVNYVGRFENGSIFDSSEGHDPLEFTVGAEQVIAGFDRVVIGMKAGESCKVVIAPEDGYGAHVPEMVAEVERHQIPDHEKLILGSMLEVSMEDGQTLEVQVVELSDDIVLLDGNHPLAGKELHFEIEILEFT
ncbi:MAG: FKBP-type peptidyl-prolyl cis-trans isomerase [Deltaproteobacteria bacterium]|nr:FKBP-type peptidyl-prolyl cis-trans isomerase [Deltaproteobacteria bacterium]